MTDMDAGNRTLETAVLAQYDGGAKAATNKPAARRFKANVNFISFLRKKKENKMCALLNAAMKGDTNVVDDLCRTFSKIDGADKDGFTPLIYAARGGFKEIVVSLCQRSVNVDARTKEGRTALHYSALSGCPEVAKILIDFHADLNCQDCEKMTPLHFAASLGYKEVVELLLWAGASMMLEDMRGRIPEDLAKENHYPEIQNLLQKIKQSPVITTGICPPRHLNLKQYACLDLSTENRITESNNHHYETVLSNKDSGTTGQENGVSSTKASRREVPPQIPRKFRAPVQSSNYETKPRLELVPIPSDATKLSETSSACVYNNINTNNQWPLPLKEKNTSSATVLAENTYMSPPKSVISSTTSTSSKYSKEKLLLTWREVTTEISALTCQEQIPQPPPRPQTEPQCSQVPEMTGKLKARTTSEMFTRKQPSQSCVLSPPSSMFEKRPPLTPFKTRTTTSLATSAEELVTNTNGRKSNLKSAVAPSLSLFEPSQSKGRLLPNVGNHEAQAPGLDRISDIQGSLPYSSRQNQPNMRQTKHQVKQHQKLAPSYPLPANHRPQTAVPLTQNTAKYGGASATSLENMQSKMSSLTEELKKKASSIIKSKDARKHIHQQVDKALSEVVFEQGRNSPHQDSSSWTKNQADDAEYTRVNDGYTNVNYGYTRVDDGCTNVNYGYTRADDDYTKVDYGYTNVKYGYTREDDGYTSVDDGYTNVNYVDDGYINVEDGYTTKPEGHYSRVDAGRTNLLICKMNFQFLVERPKMVAINSNVHVYHNDADGSSSNSDEDCDSKDHDFGSKDQDIDTKDQGTGSKDQERVYQNI